MRRAVLALLLLTVLAPAAAAYKPEGPVDAVGMIDFRHGVRFKVGDWVQYRTKGESYQGFRTDYTVTVLIAGEELWWGERCFWIETQTSYSGQPPELAATLISYSVFEDSLAHLRFGRYMRKFLDGVDEKGEFIQQPFRRAPTEIQSRTFAERDPPREVDTLGVEKVETPKGVFDALKVRQVYRETVTQQEGDSTVYFQMIEDHTFWWSDQVPITRLARIAQENTQQRRVWMIGESENAPLRIAEHSTGGTELLDFGSGMKSRTIPERFQRSIEEQQRARTRAAPRARSSGKSG